MIRASRRARRHVPRSIAITSSARSSCRGLIEAYWRGSRGHRSQNFPGHLAGASLKQGVGFIKHQEIVVIFPVILPGPH